MTEKMPSIIYQKEKLSKQLATAILWVWFRWACEGLSYLSLDADVKEWIVDDPLLMRVSSCRFCKNHVRFRSGIVASKMQK